jgi:hypothetical protein
LPRVERRKQKKKKEEILFAQFEVKKYLWIKLRRARVPKGFPEYGGISADED